MTGDYDAAARRASARRWLTASLCVSLLPSLAACGGSGARPVAPLAQDSRFAPCVEEPSEGIFGEWEGVAINYADGRPPVSIERAELAFSPGGYVGWDDGCNAHGGKYAVKGNAVAVKDEAFTQVLCEGAIPDLTRVTAFALEGQKLVLTASGERYVFRRNPYSVLTRRPWSLFSITELETGETRKVDQFRMTYGQLLMVADADERFTFTDFDHAQWSGSMTVGPAQHAVVLAWDQPSSRALEVRRRWARRPTSQPRNNPYPLGLAAELDLGQVAAFCLVENVSWYESPLMLEMRGEKYVYTWSPR